jgi:hypothetical protein
LIRGRAPIHKPGAPQRSTGRDGQRTVLFSAFPRFTNHDQHKIDQHKNQLLRSSERFIIEQ